MAVASVLTAAVIVVAQAIALLVLVVRLLPGRSRRPPVLPIEDRGPTRVSVVVPTFNEAKRLPRCLEGLMKQGPTVHDILVVDGNSSDGTAGLVHGATAHDQRVRLVLEPPLPNGWIGKVWALQHGLEHTSGEWVLNVDADIYPEPGMVAAVVQAAEELTLDVASFSPRFAGQTAAEQWVQTALLVSLVYRSGASGTDGRLPPERTLANGQCFLARRDVLQSYGGYAAARASFSDDVTLARHLARNGVRVGFLDGSRLFAVRSYTSLGEMWREWGRSIDLKDATSMVRRASDAALLALVQGAPSVVLGLWTLGAWSPHSTAHWTLIGINAALLGMRSAMLAALKPSYDRHSLGYWLSPLADPLAVMRVIWSSLRRPRTWRGRAYSLSAQAA